MAFIGLGRVEMQNQIASPNIRLFKTQFLLFKVCFMLLLPVETPYHSPSYSGNSERTPIQTTSTIR